MGDYLFDTVLSGLARCLGLFPNLHTIQLDVALGSRRSLVKVFERTFKKYSYPQIRNVYVTPVSESLLASCPNARRVAFTVLVQPITHNSQRPWHTSISKVHFPWLETLEDFRGLIATDFHTCKCMVL
jgi:hypothetical protein